LKEHHILSEVKKAYQSVEISKIKALLGFSQDSDQTLKTFLTKRGFQIDGEFVLIPPNTSESST
jgi:hypothetical protein